tara:strand:+ start:1507 stop:3612 length:2106 start_codon:yes stop_codon:yes gene_type:complete
MDQSNDKLVERQEKPDVPELAKEYIRSLHDGYSLTKVSEADNVRLTRWDGQSDDGKKHSENLNEGKQAFPWEGASDTRIPLADSIINDCVDVLTTAASRATLKVAATEIGDAEQAAVANKMMHWQLDTKLYHTINRESELLAQHGLQYGWSALFIGWEQKVSLKQVPITLEQIQQMLEQLEQDDPLRDFPNLIMNPDTENEAVEIVKAQYPDATDKEARNAVKDLRETGQTNIPRAYVSVNQPSVVALKPWEDITFPPETTDLQSARVIFRRVFLTEAELRANIVNAEWDEDWVEKIIKTAGRSVEFFDFSQSVTNISLNDTTTRQDNLIEVVYAYTRQITKDNIPGIYCTVFSPIYTTDDSGEHIHAKHELLDYAHCRYPFIEFRRERLKRRVMESRGVPEICETWQNEIKTQRDSIFDSTSFETLPPIMVNKRIGLSNKVGPAVQLPVTKPGDYEFMRPPARTPNTALNLIDIVEKQADSYFGRANPNVPPVQTQLKQQRMVNNWLTTWTEAYQQMFSLCLQYLSPEEINRITGSGVVPESDMMQFDFVLKFDVREMDTEYVDKKLATISQYVVPQDVGGVLDRNKLIGMLTKAISPDIADELIIDQTTASQKMYNDVKAEIGMMMLGNEATYVENDPSAKSKLQYAQDILGRNPKAQSALQGDEVFQQLFENYSKNLQMSIMQQENAQIGRIGVSQLT